MSNDRVIETPAPTDLPTFTILVDGEALPRAYHISALTVTKMANKIAFAKIVLLDGDPSQEDFPVSNSERLVPGKNVEIKGGYHSEETSLFKGVVTRHGIKTRPNKPSLLIIECRHVAYKMALYRRSAYFHDTRDSDVFQQVIDAYAIESEIETTAVQHKELVQYACSDWDFMVSRAEVNSMLVLTDGEKIRVKKPDFSTAPTLSLLYGATLLEIEAQIDARDQVDGVRGESWDFTNQEWITAEADEPEISEQGNLEATALAEITDQAPPALQHTGLVSEEELKAWADAQLLKSRMAKIQGRLKCNGYGEINAGDMIELQGVGERFNGRALVTGVRHEFGGGTWTTDLEFGRNSEWFVEHNRVDLLPASGLIPAVSGLQIGVVTQLEADPDGEDRIRIRMPLISTEEDGIWARIAGMDAGENRGVIFRPEIGDEVVLGFLNDDPRDPIVLGMLNSSAKPAPITATDDNHEKGVVTRSEIKMIFNDEDVSLVIETPNGNIFNLSDHDGAIQLQDENGNRIQMNSDGITIESAADINIKASGDLNIEGTNTNARASAQFKAEGSAGAEMSSSATAVLRGSLVQIN